MATSKALDLAKLLGPTGSISTDYVDPGIKEISTISSLPLSGNVVGQQAFVQETNRLYIWNGAGWYNIALINTNPTIDSNSYDAAYTLDSNGGIATVIELSASDPEGIPITWTYIASDSAQYFANITNDSSVFTITAKSNEEIWNYDSAGGTFSITFKASDGVNLATALSEFTITFTAAFGGQLLYTLDNPNPYDTSVYDYFGISVAISESYAIVGAYQEDDAGGIESGKAYIFSTATGQLLYTLDNPNAYSTSASDNFGRSVAISESYAIVGAYAEDDAGGASSGKAYIFSTATGQLLYTLNNPNLYGTSAGDYFGYSVAISESYAIVGAFYEDDAGGTSSGKAYIFSTATGQLLYTLDNPNAYGTSAGDVFGRSVAISESYAIVGAYNEDDPGGSNSGVAYVFSTATGQLLHTLDNPNAYDTSTNDTFGYSVAISESYAIVGAYNEDDASGVGSGKAYIFSTATGQLLYTLDNPNAYDTSVTDYFGYSVAISESYAIVGAYAEDDAGGTESGKAYIFSTATGQLLYTLNNPNLYGTSASDTFGYSVAISESYAIVGAYQEDDASGVGSGKAYIFN